MRLADGHIIEPAGPFNTERSIILHPDFRIIMLANRPGFPFLGNDLFSVLGKGFSYFLSGSCTSSVVCFYVFAVLLLLSTSAFLAFLI